MEELRIDHNCIGDEGFYQFMLSISGAVNEPRPVQLQNTSGESKPLSTNARITSPHEVIIGCLDLSNTSMNFYYNSDEQEQLSKCVSKENIVTYKLNLLLPDPLQEVKIRKIFKAEEYVC